MAVFTTELKIKTIRVLKSPRNENDWETVRGGSIIYSASIRSVSFIIVYIIPILLRQRSKIKIAVGSA